MVRSHLLLLVVAASLMGQEHLSRLPAWAAEAALAAQASPAPQGADAWVLLDRTEIAYAGGGEIRQRRFRLVQVLSERGRNQGTYTLRGLGGKASVVKKLRGWNLRPDGELVKLDQDEVVTIHDAGSAEYSTETLTGAVLERVQRGSLIAFESLESIRSPLGPIAEEAILETVPVRRWELEVAKKEGWFTDLKAVTTTMDKWRFEPWITRFEERPGAFLRMTDLPALPRDEGGHPDLQELLPRVRVRFLDPALDTSRMWETWDGLARWVAGHYRNGRGPSAFQGAQGRSGREALEALHQWLEKTIVYKQIYLTPERGWIPERSDEVGRKRYGDCKDMACLLLAEAEPMGFKGVPVLAALGGSHPDPGERPFPVFNHVIAALPLAQSLGWPAEVDTPRGRFLLVDPTDATTPIGHLGSAHRGRKVMLCLDGGAEWVSIPDPAILEERLAFDLEARAWPEGRLSAVLRITEIGNAWNLRGYARARGAEGLRDRLMRDLLDLPPTGSLLVRTFSDPLDLAKPFQVEVKVEHPQGFRRNADEYELVGWGIPWPRALIQKAGVPRRYPVASNAFGSRDYTAKILFPEKLEPVASARTGDSPFSAFSWTAKAERAPEGTVLSLAFHHQWRQASYGFDRCEEGVQAWRKDRSQVKTFREEALAFRVVP